VFGIGRNRDVDVEDDAAPAPPAPPAPLTPECLRAAADAHAGAVYRLALSIMRDRALADDVVQETLIKAWRAAPFDEHGAVPRSWMLKVARNTAISMLRARREELSGDGTVPETTSMITVARSAEGRAALVELLAALDRLDEDARTLIVLRELDGLSYDDIAVAMGLPLPTIKTRLFRARQSLRRAMEGWR
jgi:RNA polymerase sigma-70 factor, ECF subfamily